MADYAVLEKGDSLGRLLRGRVGVPQEGQQSPGLLIVAPGWETPCGLSCGTVLLPGSAVALLEGIRAGSAVSYGMCSRDSITLSSRRDDRVWASVQRELVRLDGAVVERQEVVMRVRREIENMQALALMGALLLLGMEPEEL